MKLADHLSVKSFYAKGAAAADPLANCPARRRPPSHALPGGRADDAGLTSIDAPTLERERAEILRFFSATKTLVSFVCRMNREPIRSPDRSVANLESHETQDRLHEVGHRIVAAMEREGVRAINTSAAFPMEMDRVSGKGWSVSHKPVAVAAGLGVMGLHRCVIHPKFGNFVLLGTVLLAAEASDYDRPLADSPCLGCKLCVRHVPRGPSRQTVTSTSRPVLRTTTGSFRAVLRIGSSKWAESKSASDYRRRVTDAETASMWQSLVTGGTYKCVYCLAVCPAGEEVIGSFLRDKRAYLDAVVRPLRKKDETVYVVPGSDAEVHVARRFPWKHAKRVGNGLRPRSIEAFLNALPLVFQRERSAGLEVVYHFTFTGEEECQATVVIQDKTVRVSPGHVGTSGLRSNRR